MFISVEYSKKDKLKRLRLEMEDHTHTCANQLSGGSTLERILDGGGKLMEFSRFIMIRNKLQCRLNEVVANIHVSLRKKNHFDVFGK